MEGAFYNIRALTHHRTQQEIGEIYMWEKLAPQSGGMLGEPDPAVVPSRTLMVIHPLQDTGTGCFYSYPSLDEGLVVISLSCHPADGLTLFHTKTQTPTVLQHWCCATAMSSPSQPACRAVAP